MKASICLFAALALVAIVKADINFWLSDTGITDPAQAFIKTEHDFMPVFDHAGGGPVVVPIDMGNCCDEPERVFFVWGEFTYPEEQPYEKLCRVHLTAATTGCLTLENSVIYRHVGRTPKGQVEWTRWDGDADLVMGPGCAGFPVATALQANGIRYDYGILGPPQTPQTYDMRVYDPVTWNTRFLIGAIHVKGNCPGDGGRLYVGLGTLGVVTDRAVPPGSEYPDVHYNGVLLQSGGALPSTCRWTLAAFIPEPANILLIGLGCLLLRRR